MAENKHKLVGNATELDQVFPKPTRPESLRSYWSSPEAFAAHIEGINPSDCWTRAGWKTGREDDWYGSKDMAAAIALARYGWKEGAEMASRLQGKVMAQHPLRKEPVRFGVAGAYPDVARAIAGNPMNMIIPDKKRSKRRRPVTLISDMCVSYYTKSVEIINRAAVVAAIVDHIEVAGYACEVITYEYTRSGGWFSDSGDQFECMTAVKVKDSGQPLDIQRIAFGLGHPAMFRRMCFAETGYNQECKVLGSGLGCVAQFEYGDLSERNIFILPSCQGNHYFQTEAKAATEGLVYLVKALQKQKFPLFINSKIEVDPDSISLQQQGRQDHGNDEGDDYDDC